MVTKSSSPLPTTSGYSFTQPVSSMTNPTPSATTGMTTSGGVVVTPGVSRGGGGGGGGMSTIATPTPSAEVFVPQATPSEVAVALGQATPTGKTIVSQLIATPPMKPATFGADFKGPKSGATQVGNIILVTPEEEASLKGLTGKQQGVEYFTYAPRGTDINQIIAETGIVTEFSKGLTRTTGVGEPVFGGITSTFAERERAKELKYGKGGIMEVTGATLGLMQGEKELRLSQKEFETEQERITKEFMGSPESFQGKPGVSSELLPTGETQLTLTPEFFQGQESYSKYLSAYGSYTGAKTTYESLFKGGEIMGPGGMISSAYILQPPKVSRLKELTSFEFSPQGVYGASVGAEKFALGTTEMLGNIPAFVAMPLVEFETGGYLENGKMRGLFELSPTTKEVMQRLSFGTKVLGNIPGGLGENIRQIQRAPTGGMELTTLGPLAVATIGTIAKSAIGGARETYAIERIGGATRTGALKESFGQIIQPFSPLQFSPIQKTTTELGPIFQVNKGGELTATKFGTFREAELYTGTGQGIYFQPSKFKYTSITAGGEIRTGEVITSQFMRVNLRPGQNVFASTGSDLTALGFRDITILGQRPQQFGRYSFIGQGGFERTIESFRGYGKSYKLISGEQGLDVSASKFFFQPVQRIRTFAETRIGDFVFPGETTFEGKAFGRGISGRPRVLRGVDFLRTKLKITTPTEETTYGTALGVGRTSGRRGILTFFRTRTIRPSEGQFEFGYEPPQPKLPRGLKITKDTGLYRPGEFDYLKQTQKTEQKIVQKTEQVGKTIKTVLSPPSSSQGLMKPQVSEYYGTGLYEVTSGGLMVQSLTSMKQTPELRQQLKTTGSVLTPSLTRMSVVPTSTIIQGSRVQQDVRQGLRQTTTEISGLRQVTPTVLIPGTTKINVPSFPTPGIPIVPFPIGPGFSETYGYRRQKRRGTKYKYQASLTSGLLGIKSFRMPKEIRIGGYSGLQLRPLVVSRPRSRRKKRK